MEAGTDQDLEARVQVLPGQLGDSRAFRVLTWVCAALSLTSLVLLAPPQVGSVGWPLLAWVALVFLVDLKPVLAGTDAVMDLDLPILLAAAFVLGPFWGGAIALLAASDPREWRREISLDRAVFNRSQKALCVILAGLVFGALGGSGLTMPEIVAAGIAATAIDFLANASFVAIGVHLLRGTPAIAVLSDAMFGSPLRFLVAYHAFALTGLVLYLMYESVGGWALLVFTPVVVVAEAAFSGASQLQEAERRTASIDVSLRAVTDQILVERADERLAIAAALHDEVLQSLHFLTLHAQVIREDLRNGRLLQLEEDVPALLEVSQQTAELTRAVVGELRRPSLGGGLARSMGTVSSNLSERFSGQIVIDIPESLEASETSQWLAYQLAREAMTNAAKHSRATTVRVSCTVVGDELVVVVADDGVGFSVSGVDVQSHFGLEIVRDRIRSAGGTLVIDSSVGRGTRLECRLPVDEPPGP